MGFVWIWVVVVCGVDYRNAYLGFCGVLFGGGCCIVHPCHPAALWIDESLITLCQRVRFQRGFRPRPE